MSSAGYTEDIRKQRAGTAALSRALWEEVFTEDSPEFLDYYDRCMADHNRIYLDEEDGRAVSMLHRNPYRVHVGRSLADVSYIVAVATSEPYRHQGRMRRLLHEALQDSYREGEPFVYLMPASEKIYLPFGFRTVGYQDVLTLGGVFARTDLGEEPGQVRAAEYGAGTDTPLSCVRARYEQLEELAALSERILAGGCSVYTERSTAYFQRIWEEQKAVNGGILLFYCGDTLRGYCLCGVEEGAEAWELVLEDGTPELYAQALHAVTEYFCGQLPLKVSAFLPGTQIAGVDRREFSYRPITMARIVNLFSLAERLRSRREIEVILDLRDAFIAQNNGRFRLRVTPDGGCLSAYEEENGCLGGHAEEDGCLSGQAEEDGRLSMRAEKGTACLSAQEEEEAGCHVLSMEIGELTDILFGIRGNAEVQAAGLEPLRPVFLNELV